MLGLLLWCRYFLEAQGFSIDSNTLFQDNKSTMLLEKNGRLSSGKRTKHIKNRYFLIADKVENQEMEVEHCPTEMMWAEDVLITGVCWAS